MTSRSYWHALAICCIAGSIHQSSAFGEISDGFSSPGDPVSLLVYAPVQGELGLTADQKKAAEELNQEFREGLKKLYTQHLRDEELRKATNQNVERGNARGYELLSPKQVERLKQISLQVREDVVRFSLTDIDLFDEELRKALSITQEQASKLQEASKTNAISRKDLRQRMKAMRFKGKNEQQQYIFAQVGEASLKRLTELLTSQQRKELERLKGPKFKYPTEDLPI